MRTRRHTQQHQPAAILLPALDDGIESRFGELRDLWVLRSLFEAGGLGPLLRRVDAEDRLRVLAGEAQDESADANPGGPEGNGPHKARLIDCLRGRLAALEAELKGFELGSVEGPRALADKLALCADELSVAAFAAGIGSGAAFAEWFEVFGELTTGQLTRLLALVLHLPPGRMRKILGPSAPLMASGIVSVDRRSHVLIHKIDVLGRPLLAKKMSDLLRPYLGQTEALIAGMFAEAAEQGAVLLLDEADGLLRDRRGASRSWEVTQVNELLVQMEAFQGLFVCATNLFEDLDAASLRRFDLKVRFDYLRPEQSWALFRQLAERRGLSLDSLCSEDARALSALENLAPGDFAAVARRLRLLPGAGDARGLLDELAKEARLKADRAARPIGFTAAV